MLLTSGFVQNCVTIMHVHVMLMFLSKRRAYKKKMNKKLKIMSTQKTSTCNFEFFFCSFVLSMDSLQKGLIVYFFLIFCGVPFRSLVCFSVLTGHLHFGLQLIRQLSNSDQQPYCLPAWPSLTRTILFSPLTCVFYEFNQLIPQVELQRKFYLKGILQY